MYGLRVTKLVVTKASGFCEIEGDSILMKSVTLNHAYKHHSAFIASHTHRVKKHNMISPIK